MQNNGRGGRDVVGGGVPSQSYACSDIIIGEKLIPSYVGNPDPWFSTVESRPIANITVYLLLFREAGCTTVFITFMTPASICKICSLVQMEISRESDMPEH